MRYRQLDANGDYPLNLPFLYNTPAVVAQAVLTRLKLWEGEWFADTSDGTPYLQNILGATTQLSPDVYIKQRILETPGVNAIVSYSSTLNTADRTLAVSVILNTIFGLTTTPVQAVL
jgi:hypothetical protein